MILYLLRHADANTEAATDGERPLSEKGVRQAARVAEFCKSRGIVPTVILTSPLARAHQTAEGFAKGIGLERLLPVDFLASGMEPKDAIRELKGYHEFESVLIVGHEPDFSDLAARLLGMSSGDRFRVKKASLTAIELSSVEEDAGTLLFSIPVKHMSP